MTGNADVDNIIETSSAAVGTLRTGQSTILNIGQNKLGSIDESGILQLKNSIGTNGNGIVSGDPGIWSFRPIPAFFPIQTRDRPYVASRLFRTPPSNAPARHKAHYAINVQLRLTSRFDSTSSIKLWTSRYCQAHPPPSSRIIDILPRRGLQNSWHKHILFFCPNNGFWYYQSFFDIVFDFSEVYRIPDDRKNFANF